MVDRRSVRRLAVLGVVAGVALLLAFAPQLGTGLVHLVPALLLLGLCASGRYVGERQLTRLRAWLHAPRRRPLPCAAPSCRPPRRVPRGGLLIASALAVRPPPAALAPR